MRHLNSKSLRSFAKEIGIKFPNLQSYNKGTSPGLDVLNEILSRQNWINAEWLITGEGEMIKSGKKEFSLDASEMLARQLKIIESQQRTIEILAKKVAGDIAESA
jgi:hypothetical protein